MEYRRLGHYGLKVSEFSLGAWVTYGGQVGEKESRKCMLAAYEAGVNFFDNADVYASGNAEIVMGEVIKDLKRTDLVISSKVFWPTGPGPNDRGLSRKHIMESCHASLKRLKVDYVDLYFCHRHDPETPLEEVVRAMDDLVHQGKVYYCSLYQTLFLYSQVVYQSITPCVSPLAWSSVTSVNRAYL